MRLWHTTPKDVERKRYFDPFTIGVGALGLGAGIASMFGGKKSRDVPDPLAGLRAQLQALAGQVPGQVARQKELTGQRIGEARTLGTQDIAENIRAERGFGSTSLQDRLNIELAEKLAKAQAEADLASDIWGTQQQASILGGTEGMYPTQTELPEEPNWMANLLGAGAGLATQNWMQEQQFNRLANLFGGTSQTPYEGKALPGLMGGLKDITSDWGSKYLKF